MSNGRHVTGLEPSPLPEDLDLRVREALDLTPADMAAEQDQDPDLLMIIIRRCCVILDVGRGGNECQMLRFSVLSITGLGCVKESCSAGVKIKQTMHSVRW